MCGPAPTPNNARYCSIPVHHATPTTLSSHLSRPVARLRPADSDDGRKGSVGQESAGIVGSAQPPASNFVFFFWCSGYFSIFSGFSFAIGEVCPGPPIPPTGRAKLLQVPLPVPCYFFSSFVPS